MNFTTRFAGINDEEKICHLYKQVAQQGNGIARKESEISGEYISTFLQRSIQNGVILVVEHPEDRSLIAEMHCYRPEPEVFHHVLSELTIVVHPDFQGKGIGKLLFTDCLKYIQEKRQDILRVELIARESNLKAITFYQSIGFKVEGRLEHRINNNHAIEADIPMAWFNQYYIKNK